MVGLLVGPGNVHAAKPQLPLAKITSAHILKTYSDHHSLDKIPAGEYEEESLISDEDDEDDCCIKRLATLFKNFLALTKYFQVGLKQEQITCSLPQGEYFSLGSPRYILQRVINI